MKDGHQLEVAVMKGGPAKVVQVRDAPAGTTSYRLLLPARVEKDAEAPIAGPPAAAVQAAANHRHRAGVDVVQLLDAVAVQAGDHRTKSRRGAAACRRSLFDSVIFRMGKFTDYFILK